MTMSNSTARKRHARIEETAEQRERVVSATHGLRAALRDVGDAGRMAAPSLNVDMVRAAITRLDKAEEELDIAMLDLAAAEGEDV